MPFFVPGALSRPVPTKSSAEASRFLQGVLAGDVPMRIQARTGADIETASALPMSLAFPSHWKIRWKRGKRVDLLKQTETPVVFGPIFDQPSGITAGSREMRNRRLHTVRDLSDAGIPMALSAQDLRGEEGLARQAMLAIRFGVDPAEALRMVTQYPAQLLGIEKRWEPLSRDAELTHLLERFPILSLDPHRKGHAGRRTFIREKLS